MFLLVQLLLLPDVLLPLMLVLLFACFLVGVNAVAAYLTRTTASMTTTTYHDDDDVGDVHKRRQYEKERH